MATPKALVRLDKKYLGQFWSRVNKTPTCWNWVGNKCGQGYGRFSVHGYVMLAHRLSFFLANRSAPPVLDHLCRNRACVNPKHLEAITVKENILRGCCPGAVNARKQFCIQGHELSGVNVKFDKQGHRRCVLCHSRRDRETKNRIYQDRDRHERIKAQMRAYYLRTKSNA